MYHDRERPDAAAYLVGGKDAPDLTGTVQFYQEAGRALVAADVEGLPQNSESGFFAFHIHEGSSCLGTEFPETGGHYNPEKRTMHTMRGIFHRCWRTAAAHFSQCAQTAFGCAISSGARW